MTSRPTAVLSAGEIASIVERLAGEIDADHPEGVAVVGVLKGSVFLVADLVRSLSVPCTIDFLALTSYAPGARRVRILKDLEQDIAAKDVVIAADIIDTGLSIHYAVDLLLTRGARQVRVCTLLDRPERRIIPVPLTYCGATAHDDFLVGYGLDYAGRYRNLPGIFPVDPEELRIDPTGFESEVFGVSGVVSRSDPRE